MAGINVSQHFPYRKYTRLTYRYSRLTDQGPVRFSSGGMLVNESNEDDSDDAEVIEP